MKFQFLLLFLSFSMFANAQSRKASYQHYNEVMELKGTDYVIVFIEKRSKVKTQKNALLFINSRSAKTQEIEFPAGSFLNKVEQIKIDDASINKVLVAGRTVKRKGKKSISWNDPQQIYILSTDGRTKTKITDDEYFVSNWGVNNQTGMLTITGFYDVNGNGKRDKADRNEIILYDLREMVVVKRI